MAFIVHILKNLCFCCFWKRIQVKLLRMNDKISSIIAFYRQSPKTTKYPITSKFSGSCQAGGHYSGFSLYNLDGLCSLLKKKWKLKIILEKILALGQWNIRHSTVYHDHLKAFNDKQFCLLQRTFDDIWKHFFIVRAWGGTN